MRSWGIGVERVYCSLNHVKWNHVKLFLTKNSNLTGLAYVGSKAEIIEKVRFEQRLLGAKGISQADHLRIF